MRSLSSHRVFALCLALLGGCSAPPDTGSARFAVSIPQALAASVSRVSITTGTADFPSLSVETLSVELRSSNGSWDGLLGHLPTGAHRTFLAQAFDGSDTLLLQGSVSDVPLSAHQTALVALTLRAPDAPSALDEPPVIDSLVASSTTVPPGGTLSLQAVAQGLHPGESLDSTWSSSAGISSSATGPSTTWTAPTTPGTQVLTFTVRNASGRSSSASVPVTVTSGGGSGSGQGGAQVTVTFNSAPSVTSLGATLAQLGVGQTTTVSASATDVDGDSLAYAWSASCAGSWAQATSSTARFTPSALPTASCDNCDLTVAISDGRGGQTTGTLSLCVSATPAPHHFDPTLLRTYSSLLPGENASAGQVLTYEVAASDPEGSALAFSWSANTGSLGTAAHTATQSRVTWTAPTCASEGTTPTLLATVTNAFNLTATSSFPVLGLPTCVLSAWTPAGNLVSARTNHTATPLQSGKVLVAGGQNPSGYLAKAEVYDAASGTWSATGTMLSTRHLHAAAVLQSGKVLVSGGYNGSYLAKSEVYDPASGTWSNTGTLLSARYLHVATPLQDGRVLVSGGWNSTSGYLAASEAYNPTSGTWSSTGALAAPRAYHTATLLQNGKVLVSGGRDSSNFLATAELYDPASGTWSTTGAMSSPRASHTATLLKNGKVLVSGGTNRTVYLQTAEVYDPASGSWSTVGPMNSTRTNHAAALLQSGKVLVSGGIKNSNSYLAKAEVYDPASSSWSEVNSMASSRSQHTATPLPGGKLLVSGGYNVSGSLATAEVYAP